MVQALRYEKFDEIMSENSLMNFLINRVKSDLNLATLFYWYISVECPDKTKKDSRSIVSQFYETILSEFQRVLQEEQSEIWEALSMQIKLRERFKEINDKIRRMDLAKKKEELKKIAASNEFQKNSFQDQPFCLNTNYHITSMEPEDCTVFKSAMAPLRLCFHAYNAEEKEKVEMKYKVIYKSGDDLRQDQLMIQMITLMDSLLKGVNVDCQLTPYKILACSKSDGYLEFVPDSYTMQDILKESSLTNFFKKIADEQKTKEEIKAALLSLDVNKKGNVYESILNNFIDSCAGYCVITYFLGIGDRHKENLMINNKGLLLI